jgi:hypothetical protein
LKIFKLEEEIMSKNTKGLTKRQLEVLDDLFGDQEEKEVLKRHKVSGRVYRKWLADEVFADELRFRIESARRAGEIIIAKSRPGAAKKLVGLIDSSTGEICRRVCLDVMSGGAVKRRKAKAAKKVDGDKKVGEIEAGLATKLLEVLAEYSNKDGAS